MGALEWQADAVCAQVDPELFFPGKGQDAQARAAKAICASCDVREKCIAWAVENDLQGGIFGGLNQKSRDRIRRAANIPDASRQRRDREDRTIAAQAAAGRTPAEIAVDLEMSADNVSARLARMRAREPLTRVAS